MPGPRHRTIRVVLVGGPMYDRLYDTIPDFERETGLAVEVVARLPHPALNTWIDTAFTSGDPDIDLLSTHTKYAPSQADWLAPLDGLLGADHLADLLPRAATLSRIGGRLLQAPRCLDVRLLHYRTDLFDDAAVRTAFAAEHGRPLRVPVTWTELAEVAAFLTRPGQYGFVFPGRDSGLFGTFYELLVGAGGRLFDQDLQPAFDSPAGVWAASFLQRLHRDLCVTPRTLAQWHYDEVSAAFRAGEAAMAADWPGSYHLYRSVATCRVFDRVALAPLPEGPAGVRAAYAGCHSFAVAASAKNREAAGTLLRWLLTAEAQLGEARRGAVPCRQSAMAMARTESAGDGAARDRWTLLDAAEKTMIVPPRFAAYPRCEDAIWRALQRTLEGEVTAAEAVRGAAVAVRSILTTETAVES